MNIPCETHSQLVTVATINITLCHCWYYEYHSLSLMIQYAHGYPLYKNITACHCCNDKYHTLSLLILQITNLPLSLTIQYVHEYPLWNTFIHIHTYIHTYHSVSLLIQYAHEYPLWNISQHVAAHTVCPWLSLLKAITACHRWSYEPSCKCPSPHLVQSCTHRKLPCKHPHPLTPLKWKHQGKSANIRNIWSACSAAASMLHSN